MVLPCGPVVHTISASSAHAVARVIRHAASRGVRVAGKPGLHAWHAAAHRLSIAVSTSCHVAPEIATAIMVRLLPPATPPVRPYAPTAVQSAPMLPDSAMGPARELALPEPPINPVTRLYPSPGASTPVDPAALDSEAPGIEAVASDAIAGGFQPDGHPLMVRSAAGIRTSGVGRQRVAGRA